MNLKKESLRKSRSEQAAGFMIMLLLVTVFLSAAALMGYTCGDVDGYTRGWNNNERNIDQMSRTPCCQKETDVNCLEIHFTQPSTNTKVNRIKRMNHKLCEAHRSNFWKLRLKIRY